MDRQFRVDTGSYLPARQLFGHIRQLPDLAIEVWQLEDIEISQIKGADA